MTKAHNQLIADIKEMIADGFEEGMSLDDIANNIVIATLGQPQSPLIQKIEAEARRYAEMYPQSSDGRNTFIIFADWIVALSDTRPDRNTNSEKTNG